VCDAIARLSTILIHRHSAKVEDQIARNYGRSPEIQTKPMERQQ
jgi:hypothetical protein